MRNSIAASSFFRCDGANNSVLIGPGVLLLHRRNQRQPVRNVVVAQPAGAVLHIGLEMKQVSRRILRGGCAQVPQAASEASAIRAPQASV